MALSVTITSRTETSITARVSTSGSVAMQHNWYIDGSLDGTVQTAAGTTTSTYKFTGLDPGTSYDIQVDVYAYNPWRLLDSGYATGTTISSDTTYYARLILDGNGGTLNDGSDTSTWEDSADSSGSSAYVSVYYNCTFVRSGYTFLGYSESPYATTADYGKSGYYSIRATSESYYSPTTDYLYAVWRKNRPDNWYWSSTVSKGAEIPFTRSGNVITCKPLTAYEWNRFIDRIFEFLDYTGNSVSGDTSGFYVTAGTEMTAATVDLARQLIAVMDPPTALPSAISSGGRITAAYINGLKNSLNSI